MLSRDEKIKIVSEFGRSANDTGCCEAQVAIISERIKQISGHLKVAAKDFHSQRGLLMLVGQRRRLMNYLKKNDSKRYEGLIVGLKSKGYIQ